MMGRLYFAFFVVGILAAANAAIISVDFGSEFMKVALVKPGVPMEIVLDKESRRKTDALVGIKNGERFFAGEAATLVYYLL